MGARGPLPQSNVVRMRRANPGDKEAPARPVVKAGPIRAPSWLTAADKRIFRQLAKQLEEAGLYTPVDATALGLALAHAAVAARAYKELSDADTELVSEDGKNDRLAKHPLSQVMRDHASAFFAAAKDLGMAPGPRLRLNLTTETDPGPDDDLFDT